MSALLFDFSRHATIEAAGDDARTFLHNMSSNDIKGLEPGHGREAFFLTATAKVVGHAWIWRHAPQGKAERLEIDSVSNLFAHLRRYIIGEDVELTDRTAEVARLYLAAEAFDAAPLTFHVRDGVTVRRRDLLGRPGFDLIGPPDEIADLRQTLLESGTTAADEATFHALRIEAGMPWFGHDIDETTFAPETGRIVQAISYMKGCYLGQEPVVMARDRGVVQRTLIGLDLGETPATGPLTKDGVAVGKVTSAALSARLGHAVGLGYAKRGSQAAGTVLRLGDREVRVAALPFGGV